MDLEQFRLEAHRLADWMTDYLATVGDRRIVPLVEPGDVRQALPSAPPEAPEPFAQIREDVDRVVLPGMTHWGHPGFFGYFPSNHSPPSILAEMMMAAIGAQCMSWQTSPAGTEVEQVVMDWLRQMLGLPDSFTGVIQDYASSSTLVALITARDRRREDLDRATVYTSREAHSSVAKGARLAGYRPELIRAIPVDRNFAMRIDALEAAIRDDRAAGLVPSVIIATRGTTSTTGFDSIPDIAPIAEREGAWLHVDAAFAGSAAVVPEFRWVLDGVEHADSLVVNPHKWLLVNHDFSAYFVRDPEALVRSMGTSPEYLKTKHDAEVVNYRDWGIPLGRRFRALKLWFVIRSYGVEGLRAMIREHVRLGLLFAEWVDAHPALELAAPAPVGLVCFRWRPSGRTLTQEQLNDANRLLLERVNAEGDLFLTHTVLDGQYTLRLALGHLSTDEAIVRRVWERVVNSIEGLAPV